MASVGGKSYFDKLGKIYLFPRAMDRGSLVSSDVRTHQHQESPMDEEHSES